MEEPNAKESRLMRIQHWAPAWIPTRLYWGAVTSRKCSLCKYFSVLQSTAVVHLVRTSQQYQKNILCVYLKEQNVKSISVVVQTPLNKRVTEPQLSSFMRMWKDK